MAVPSKRTRIVWWLDDGEGRSGAFESFDAAQAFADADGCGGIAIGWQEVAEKRAVWLLAEGPEVAW